MPNALRGGTETFWRTWGTGAPTALMLHCSLAHSGVWTGIVDRLGLSAIGPDFPGHGKTAPRDVTQDFPTQCLRVAESFLTETPMDVIAHSFGAFVGLRLAVENPHLVRRLVLIEPIFFAAAQGTPAFESNASDLKLFMDAYESGDFVTAAQRFTDTWGAGMPWAAIPAAQRQAFIDNISIIPAQDNGIFGDNAGLLQPGRLEAVTAPVLLLEGGKSPPIISGVNTALLQRLPNARRERLAHAGHMLPLTHAAETAALIADFLSA